jgi:hypothetical protein
MQDIIGNLPEIAELDFKNEFKGNGYDLFIQAVGFETRTIGIAKNLALLKDLKIDEAILISYQTNVADNLFYDKELRGHLSSFVRLVSTFSLDDNFDEAIRQKLQSLLKGKKIPKILIDFSTLSTRLILSLTKLLFQEEIELIILYTEGLIYHPTEKEFEKIVSDKEDDSKLSQTYGIERVRISPEYNGGSKENQDLVICFPSFTAERTDSIITTVDDLLYKQNDKERLIWIIGDPHMEEPRKSKRKEMQVYLNELTNEDKIYYTCTLDYKKTLEVLDHIYKDVYSRYHITISDLGSKMQSLGIAIFSILRRDVTVYYSEPKEYNPTHFSEGIKDYWIINVGNTKDFLKQLYLVDQIELRKPEKIAGSS